MELNEKIKGEPTQQREEPISPPVQSKDFWDKLDPLFPYILTFIGTVITIFLTYQVQSTNNDTTLLKTRQDIQIAAQNAAYTKRKDEIELLKYLVPQLIDIDPKKRKNAKTLLQSIYRNDNEELVKLLSVIYPDTIKKGIDSVISIANLATPQEWGIIAGSDKDLMSAQDEKKQIANKGFPKVAIFKRADWYYSVILGYSSKTDAVNANYSAATIIRPGTTVICINDWAKNMSDKGDYFDIPVYSKVSQIKSN